MGTSPYATLFYIKPTWVSNPVVFSQTPLQGVKVGVTSLEPWDRLRPYHQDGSYASFSHVWEGPPGHAVTLEKKFTEQMKPFDARHTFSGLTCEEVFICSLNQAFDAASSIIEASQFIELSLKYENYSARNKSQHLVEQVLPTFRPYATNL
jgi:hypothetical protein